MSNSTLSLHIAAYENSIEAKEPGDAGLEVFKKFGKTWKNFETLVNDYSSNYQNSFEFPRQQENQITQPAVVQFKSSQRLFIPYKTKFVSKNVKPKKEVSKDLKDEIREFLRRTACPPPTTYALEPAPIIFTSSPRKVIKEHPSGPPPPPPVAPHAAESHYNLGKIATESYYNLDKIAAGSHYNLSENDVESQYNFEKEMASRGQLVMEDMLKEVQNLVDGLKNKNEVAEWCLAQGNVVTDKLAVMKEYNQEVGFVNTFHAPEGRANLVASLQHESRQIQALQEENRQLEYAIEEMEHGMEMMMAKHREIILNCRRSDKMLDLLAKLQLTPPPSNSEKTVEMAKLLQECIEEHAEENSKFLKDIARLKTENSVLRRLLHASSAENLKIDAIIDKLKDSSIPDDTASKSFCDNKVVEEQEGKSESSDNELTQSDETLCEPYILTPKNSKPNVSNPKVQAAGTNKN